MTQSGRRFAWVFMFADPSRRASAGEAADQLALRHARRYFCLLLAAEGVDREHEQAAPTSYAQSPRAELWQMSP